MKNTNTPFPNIRIEITELYNQLQKNRQKIQSKKRVSNEIIPKKILTYNERIFDEMITDYFTKNWIELIDK